MDERHDEHYLQSVTDMGDSRRVVTNQAIYAGKGIKLVEKGVRVNSSMFDRLVKHKLIPQIDQCLSVEGGVTQNNLREDARQLLENDPSLSVLCSRADYRDRMLRAFYAIPLLDALSFKLTVARDQRQEVYEHSLRVAVVALYLAIKSKLYQDQQLPELAAAALFHDLGVLHVSKELLKPGRRLQQSERHYLYAHPVTGYLILREYPDYHPEISRAVFEHHERLDGSGYPRGIKGDDISLGAQVLMLAEVANTVFERNPRAQSAEKLSVLLRLNQKKFNHELSSHLISLLRDMQVEPGESAGVTVMSTLQSRLGEVASVFQEWNSISVQCRETSQLHAGGCVLFAIIDERISDLLRTLQDAGCDVDHPAALLEILREDLTALSELQILVDETRWQLAEIMHEARRRAREAASQADKVHPTVFEWLERSERTLKIA